MHNLLWKQGLLRFLKHPDTYITNLELNVYKNKKKQQKKYKSN